MAQLYRVRTQLVGGSGASQVSTMYFATSDGLLAQDAATAVRTFWDNLKGRIANDYTVQVENEVITIDVATGEPYSSSAVTSSPVVGLQEAEPLPWATQGLVQWATGAFIGGRRLRGRTFIPGTTATDNTVGVPTTTYKSGLQSAAAALIGDTASMLVIYSRAHTTYQPVIAGTAWAKWAELRSRRD